MQKTSFFDHSSNVQITNSNIAINQSMDPSAGLVLRFIYDAMAKYAGGGHQDPSTCLEGTRTTSLQEIDKWKNKNKEEQGSELMWLTGSAGSGKTAIAQTVREEFREEGLFVVDCSFFRSTNCTNPKYLFLKIAYQLAVGNPPLKASIEAVVQCDPAVVDAPLDVLLERLILNPITKAGSQLHTIFVVLDGLDECEGEAQQIHIIHLIQSIIKDRDLPLRFLIASRPEIWIANAFSSPAAPLLSTVTLNQDSEANNDIRFFYQTEFTKIRQHTEHAHLFPSTSTPWPSEHELKLLVEWASGQFVFAKTITRFIGEPGLLPMHQLEKVLQPHSKSTKSGSPLDRLDALYSHILSCAVDWDTASSVVGALAIFELGIYIGPSRSTKREALSIIEVIHGLKPGQAYLTLRNLHPVVFVPPDLTSVRDTMTNKEYSAILENDNQHPRFYHKSFTDFIHDPQRAGKYFIDKEKSDQMLAIGCLQVLQSVSLRPPTRLFSLTWYYAVHNWEPHCRCSGSKGNQELLKVLSRFSFTSWCFLVWKVKGNVNWAKLAPFRHLETWNDDGFEAMQKVHKTLKHLSFDLYFLFAAPNLWNWIKAWARKSQSDISSLDFVKLRVKFWILHKLSDEEYI